jgi:hypothetical protein
MASRGDELLKVSVDEVSGQEAGEGWWDVLDLRAP